jgi:hypothetical protein
MEDISKSPSGNIDLENLLVLKERMKEEILRSGLSLAERVELYTQVCMVNEKIHAIHGNEQSNKMME